MTSWHLDQRVRGKGFWEIALSYTNYDFEYRLAMVIEPTLPSFALEPNRSEHGRESI